MNTKEIEKNIKIFIDSVYKKYNNIFIAYEYSVYSECYEIWHNREDLEFEDLEFKRFTGKLLYDLFLSKGIYNVYISYDYEKSKNLFTMGSGAKIPNIWQNSIKNITLENESLYSRSKWIFGLSSNKLFNDYDYSFNKKSSKEESNIPRTKENSLLDQDRFPINETDNYKWAA